MHRSSTRGHGIASAAVAARRPSGRGGVSEAHLPAEQPQASQAPRVPSPHVDESRSRGARRPASQGPAPAVGLSRLHGRSSHAAVRRHGRRVRSGPLSVTVLVASPAQDRARVEVGWAIGRRVGTAVTRNRLRRRLRALLADEHRATPLALWRVRGSGSTRPPPVSPTRGCRATCTSLLSLCAERCRHEHRRPDDPAVRAPVPDGACRPTVAVSLRPELLHLRPRGRRDAWRGAGHSAGRAKGVPLPSMGRTRLRPGA